MDYFSFENLRAYKAARSLVKDVYTVIDTFPATERYSLCDQLRRAIISVPSNIAEGSGRRSIKEKIHFLEISFGSLMEAYCQLEIALDLGYITTETHSSIKNKFYDVSRLINGLSSHFEQQSNNHTKTNPASPHTP